MKLSHFDRDEVESYIKFRLQRAGEVPVTFEKGAIKTIYKASKEIPRLIPYLLKGINGRLFGKLLYN